MANQIVLTLHVPSVEHTAAWYERILGWEGHYDTFDDTGQCLFGSVMLHESPFVGLNLSRSPKGQSAEQCNHCSVWVYVDDVDVVYNRVREQGWPIESAIENQFWGDRLFRLRDMDGNHLVIAQQIKEVNIEEIRKRQNAK